MDKLDTELMTQEIMVHGQPITPIVELCKMALDCVYGQNFEYEENKFNIKQVLSNENGSEEYGVIGEYLDQRIGFTCTLQNGWKEF